MTGNLPLIKCIEADLIDVKYHFFEMGIRIIDYRFHISLAKLKQELTPYKRYIGRFKHF